MEQEANDLLELLNDEYIGDDLTVYDLQNAYSAFLEDEQREILQSAASLVLA